ncbi:MAG: HoxN/HupN/NixA family nickel/cobalt transporter [Gammaproteobacteria bacterium]
MRRRLMMLATTVAGINLLAFGAFAGLAEAGAVSIGIGVLAYILGVRHAFDLDHIAAIDNVTRRLRALDQRPVAVGLFFSLGHSTVVFALTAVLALAAGHSATLLDPSVSHLGAITANMVSAVFLTVIGILNLALLRRLLKQRDNGENLSTVSFRPLIRLSFARVDRSWKMYPLGMLFGLGFDTASEIALLAISVTAAQTGLLSVWEVMAFPLLFMAGMSLTDTLEGLLMLRLYDWAIADQGRTLRLNLLLTAVSVCIALGVAGLRWCELLLPASVPASLTSWAGSTTLGVGLTLAMAALWLLAWRLRSGRQSRRSTR